MGVIIPAAIGAASGIYKFVSGVKNTKEAKRLSAMKRPDYEIPDTEYDAYRAIQARGNRGLSAGSKQILQENADRGLSSSIGAVLQGGGNPGDIANLYDSYMGGINQMTLANDQAQINNFNNAINADYRMSNFVDKKWMTNEFTPWADAQQKSAQLRALGEGQKTAGVNAFASSLMGAFGQAGKGGGSEGGMGGGQQSMAPPPGGGDGGGGNAPGWYPPMASPNAGGSGGDSPDWFPPMASKQPDYYGVDVSKMKPADAQMMQQLLYGN